MSDEISSSGGISESSSESMKIDECISSSSSSSSSSSILKAASEGENAGNASSAQLPRFEIKKWNAVAMWSWDICADTCAICRNSLNEPSIEYQV